MVEFWIFAHSLDKFPISQMTWCSAFILVWLLKLLKKKIEDWSFWGKKTCCLSEGVDAVVHHFFDNSDAILIYLKENVLLFDDKPCHLAIGECCDLDLVSNYEMHNRLIRKSTDEITQLSNAALIIFRKWKNNKKRLRLAFFNWIRNCLIIFFSSLFKALQYES